MKKIFCLPAVACVLLAAGCSESPAPTADPVELELALASLAKQDGGPAARFQEKIAPADKDSSTLMKVEPSKLDPKMVSVFLR